VSYEAVKMMRSQKLRSSNSDIEMDYAKQADRLTSVLNAMPMPALIYELNELEAIRHVTPSFTQTFGFTLSDIPWESVLADLTCFDTAHRGEVMQRWVAAVEHRQRTGICAPPIENQLLDKWGKRRYVLIGFSLQDNLVIVTVQDITEMRQTEASLAAESESMAGALTKNMPVGAFTMIQHIGERTPKFNFVSNRFLAMVGMTRSEVQNSPQRWLSVIHVDDRARWMAMINAETDRLAPLVFETRIDVQNATRWMRAEAIPRLLPCGSSLWEGVLLDITKSKETEQRLSAVISASRAMSWQADLLNYKATFDAAWAIAHGLPAEQNLRDFRNWMSNMHPEDFPNFRHEFEKLRSGKIGKFTLKYRTLSEAGEIRWFQVHAGISGYGGISQPTFMSGVTFDITAEVLERERELEEKWLLREDLQRAERSDTLAQISGKVAHELNNMISVISGTTELMRMQHGAQPDVLKGLDRIERSVAIAQDLVDGLGGVDRPRHLRTGLNLGSLIVDVLDMLGNRRVTRNAVRIDMPASPVSVWGSRTELTQVIMNLAINACDSGTDINPATVSIAVRADTALIPSRLPDVGMLFKDVPTVQFIITDTGAGLSADVRSHMFRPYFTTKGISGTGLGLPIVASIVNDNKAALWVDSILGQGTSFTVVWPAGESGTLMATAALGAPSMQGHNDPQRDVRLDGLNVLVVDNILEVAEGLGGMLEAAGASEISETDPSEAKRTLAEAPEVWSVLVTDLSMDGLDGRDLARFAASLTPPVPVVLVTARKETLTESELELFASALSKPVSSFALASAVQSAAKGRHP
jgi:signal transduction histidine kinase